MKKFIQLLNREKDWLPVEGCVSNDNNDCDSSDECGCDADDFCGTEL